MAYNQAERFPPPQKYFTLLDPGAYQYESTNQIKVNKAPFLTKAARKTEPGVKVWTHALYNAHMSHKIPNCTSLISSQPRFPYEAFSKEDLEEILCKCGVENTCDCFTDEVENEVTCQGKVRRRIFKGAPPRTVSSDAGLSAPSKNDRGFDILSDGSKRRIRKEILDENPPFYDIRVNESTAFYQGCKWSKWSSKRSPKSSVVRPGPADYIFERQLNDTDRYQEKFREFKCKTSKQPRFIEIIQARNIAEGRPGPASYSPTLPKGTELQIVGPKAERYPTSKYNEGPGPADYFIRRNYDRVEIPKKPIHAKLPEPACFSMKALRFKPQNEEGPSPASYYVDYKPQVLHCSKVPFGTSSIRFKNNVFDSEDKEFEKSFSRKIVIKEQCPSHTWEFKSKTIRMQPLEKKYDEPSPADLPQKRHVVERSCQLQYLAPFLSSEGRFQPWHNWIPVLGKEKTPGPGSYDLKEPACSPAVHHGPLSRSARFPSRKFQSPASNEYKVGGGIEVILRTHNQTLLNNMENQHKFYWIPKEDPRIISPEEKEYILLQKSIALLDIEDGHSNKSSRASCYTIGSLSTKSKPKMLRCFVYSNKVAQFF